MAQNWSKSVSERIPRQQPFQLHRLLGQCIIATEVCAPRWIAFRFASGDTLRVFNSSPDHESFSIAPGDIVV